MSFVIVVYNRSAIVLASDSRQTVMIHTQTPEGKSLPPFETIGTDYMPKIFLCEKNNVGIATHGDVILEGERIDSVIPRFFEMEVDVEDSVYSTAKKLRDFFSEYFPKARTSFLERAEKILDRAYDICRLVENPRYRVRAMLKVAGAMRSLPLVAGG
ncbi:MAG: hypothetical protein V2G43_04925 [bacterium JZ-2024 1]